MGREKMPDSEHLLYVGSYALPEEPGIYAFSLDTASGALTARGAAAGVAKPSFIALHPGGRWLYAVSETGEEPDGAPGSVWALDIASTPTRPTPINQQPSGGDWPCHLAIDLSGHWLLVANYASGSVGVLPIGADGALGPLSDLAQ